MMLLLGIVLGFPPATAAAETISGKIERLGTGSVTIAGRALVVSPARTNICVAGICDQSVDKLKTGQTCSAELADHQGKTEARRLACR